MTKDHIVFEIESSSGSLTMDELNKMSDTERIDALCSLTGTKDKNLLYERVKAMHDIIYTLIHNPDGDREAILAAMKWWIDSDF